MWFKLFCIVVLLIFAALIIRAAMYSVNTASIITGGAASLSYSEIADEIARRGYAVRHNAARSASEAYAIKCLEAITGKKFVTVHLPWLKYRGRYMELDGYNDELKLGIEFNGPMHYEHNSAIESRAQYEERVEKDKLKRELCAANGVKLITLSYKVSPQFTNAYLKSRLYDFGVIGDKPIDYYAALETSAN